MQTEPHYAICDWCHVRIENPVEPVRLMNLRVWEDSGVPLLESQIELNCLAKLMGFIDSIRSD